MTTRPSSRRRATAALLAVVLGLPLALVPASPGAAETVSDCDIDADGRDDLVAGVPNESVPRTDNAGAFHEFLAGDSGLAATNTWFLTQPEADTRIGETLVCVDINQDGFADVIQGVPFYESRALRLPRDSGRIDVIYGGPTGLGTATGVTNQVITQNTRGVAGRAQASDVFGFDLSWCDFDSDGYPDVSVGVPGEDIGGARDAGAVQVIYGGPNGLTARDRAFNQNSPGMKDRAETGDFFGSYLTTADINGDGYCDLAVGIPLEDVGSITDAGAIQIIYGGPNGLATRNEFVHRNSRGVAGEAARNERFGAPMYFARPDLRTESRAVIVGVPGHDVNGRADAGSVHIFPGGPRGLNLNADRIIHRASPGILSAPAADAQFGRSVFSGDFDGDGNGDLAIGVPGDRVAGRSRAGSVQILFGNGRGYTNRDLLISQLTIRGRSGVQANSFFGATMAGGDFDGDGRTDLAIGVPYADFTIRGRNVPDGGVVHTVPGAARGMPRARGGQVLSQGMFPLNGLPPSLRDMLRAIHRIEACDNFGNFNPRLIEPLPDGVVAPGCRGGRTLDGGAPVEGGYDLEVTAGGAVAAGARFGGALD